MSQNPGVPSIQQFLDIASKADGEFEVLFSGYRILPPRDDVRVAIEAIKFKPKQGGIPVDIEEPELDPNAPDYDERLRDETIRNFGPRSSEEEEIINHLIAQYPLLSTADEIGQIYDNNSGYIRFWWS
jgi:hypothetical protein